MAFQFGELPFRGRPVPRSAAITTTATPSLDLSTTSLSSSTPAVPTKGTVQLAFSKPAADQRSALLSFPDEVKVRILSCVPIASIPTIWGATCQELHGLIADRKQHIIELITQRELARSGAQVNKIKDFQDSIRTGRPDSHDFIQLFRGLKIWTRLRGVTPGVRKTILSYVSWLEHLRPLQGPSEGRQRTSIQLSTAFLALKVYSRKKKSARYRRRISVFNHLLKSVPMSSAERDLWKKESKKTIEGQTRRQRILDTRGYEAIIHLGMKSMQDTLPRFRLTTCKACVGDFSIEPTVRARALELLDLPELPDDWFGYYIEEEWCCGLLERDLPLSMLEKAAVLQQVKIF